MKKIVVLLMMILALSGCTKIDIEEVEISELIAKVTESNDNRVNHSGIGYSYYLPLDVKVEDVIDSNEVLYSDGNSMYLHVDLISYKNKVLPEYEINNDVYFSQDLANGKNLGYVEVEKRKDYYFIEMVYNYATIEAYAYSYEIDNILSKMIQIITSIEYNDVVINSLVDVTEGSKTDDYKVFKPTEKSSYLIDSNDSLIDTSKVIEDPDFLDINFGE